MMCFVVPIQPWLPLLLLLKLPHSIHFCLDGLQVAEDLCVPNIHFHNFPAQVLEQLVPVGEPPLGWTCFSSSPVGCRCWLLPLLIMLIPCC